MCLDEAVIQLEPPRAGLGTLILRDTCTRISGFGSYNHASESLGIFFFFFFSCWFENRKLAHILTEYLALVFSPWGEALTTNGKTASLRVAFFCLFVSLSFSPSGREQKGCKQESG